MFERKKLTDGEEFLLLKLKRARQLLGDAFVDHSLDKSYYFDWKHVGFYPRSLSRVGHGDASFVASLLSSTSYLWSNVFEDFLNEPLVATRNARIGTHGADIKSTGSLPLVLAINPHKKHGITVLRRFEIAGLDEVASISDKQVTGLYNLEKRFSTFVSDLQQLTVGSTLETSLYRIRWPAMSHEEKQEARQKYPQLEFSWISDQIINSVARWFTETSLTPDEFYAVDSLQISNLAPRYNLDPNDRGIVKLRQSHSEILPGKKFLFFPIHFESHWTLFIHRPDTNQLHYFDSLNNPPNPKLTEFILDVYTNNQAKLIVRKAVKQIDPISCGCFLLYYVYLVFATGELPPDNVVLHGVDIRSIHTFRFSLETVIFSIHDLVDPRRGNASPKTTMSQRLVTEFVEIC